MLRTMPKKRREKKILTLAETEALKASCVSFSDQVIVFVPLYTAMRVDEVCHLKSSWISEDCTVIFIPKEDKEWIPERLKKGITKWHPKAAGYRKHGSDVILRHTSSRPAYVLNPSLIPILKQMVEHNYMLKMNPKEVWIRLNQLWKNAGFKDRISIHFLRHTALSRLAHEGFTVDDIKGQAGHTDGAFTFRTYIQADNVMLERRLKEHGGIE